MADNLDIKVVIKQGILPGSRQAEYLQQVATVYIDGRQYRVFAPPDARGDALDWKAHWSVREPEGMSCEIVVQGPLMFLALNATEAELKKQKRDANRAQGMHPDGVHCDAQICLKGHVLQWDGTPFERSTHCTKCGALCIDECPSCGEPIWGVHMNISPALYSCPLFCHRCGKPYPWMEDRLNTSRELLARADKLPPEDRNKVWEYLQDVMSDPKAELAPAKKKLIETMLEKAPAVREFVLELIAKTTAEILKG